MRNTMFRRLPLEQAVGQSYGGGRHRLPHSYRTSDLVILGLGVMIGAGIFRVSGIQAATEAGPAVILSFVLAGAACLLAALSYAELSSIIPVAGSAYSFTYVAFGELFGWLVGWAVIVELLLAASAVARAWSQFVVQTLGDFHVVMPPWLAAHAGHEHGFDVFALAILLLLTLTLATGSRISMPSLWMMVLAKLLVIGLVISVGLSHFKPSNLRPFIPPAQPVTGSAGQTVLDALTGGTSHAFGLFGVFAAAPTIVFAYVGFDLITTSAEETRHASRRIPRGMLISLLMAVALYVAVAVVMVGMTSYRTLDPAKPPLTTAFTAAGLPAMGTVADIGAVLGLTTVMHVLLISLTRILFSMGRDRLLPPGLAVVGRFQVPTRATLLGGLAAVVMSQTLNMRTLEQLVALGTLIAFVFVSGSVIVLRRRLPDLPRPFRIAAVPLTPALAILATGWLMLNLKVQSWAYFGIWMGAGLLFYLAYGRRRSALRAFLGRPRPPRHAPARRLGAAQQPALPAGPPLSGGQVLFPPALRPGAVRRPTIP